MRKENYKREKILEKEKVERKMKNQMVEKVISINSKLAFWNKNSSQVQILWNLKPKDKLRHEGRGISSEKKFRRRKFGKK